MQKLPSVFCFMATIEHDRPQPETLERVSDPTTKSLRMGALEPPQADIGRDATGNIRPDVIPQRLPAADWATFNKPCSTCCIECGAIGGGAPVGESGAVSQADKGVSKVRYSARAYSSAARCRIGDIVRQPFRARLQSSGSQLPPFSFHPTNAELMESGEQ